MKIGVGAVLMALAAAVAGCATPSGSQAAPGTPLEHLPALTGDYFPIQSAAAGGKYHIYIRYPEGYAEAPQRRYPVVYLLDGDSLFPYMAPHHLFLTYDDKLPEAILVGIAYGGFGPVNRRGTDFGAGAAAFHSFLKSELIPAVERRVRGDPDKRVLVGQSLGGGFVLYSGYADPDLFWGRIVSNPSYQAHRQLVSGAPPRAQRGDLKLAVASGTNDRPHLRAGALEWFAAQAGQAGPWQVRRIDIDGGTHAADMPNAYRRAMRWLFDLPD
jgi:predicted alpha/beta superfamily hydrolase